MRFHHNVTDWKSETLDEDPDWWAVEMWINFAVWADEQKLREGVLQLVAAADRDGDFDNLSAGVMECIDWTDEDRLQWLEAQCRVSEAFRRSLANGYFWGEQPDAVVLRVEAAARTRLPRPIGW